MNTGYSYLQVNPEHKSAPYVSLMQNCPDELDEFSKVMHLVQSLSTDKPFRPEWLFNKEMPEEVRMYLRQIFQQRVKGITMQANVDVEGISDEDLVELSPRHQETVDDYRLRVNSVLSRYQPSLED